MGRSMSRLTQIPLVEASAAEAAKNAAPTGSEKQKIRVKPRPSVLVTDVGKIELDGNGSDPGDSGDDSPSGKEGNSQEDPDDFQNLRNVTTRSAEEEATSDHLLAGRYHRKLRSYHSSMTWMDEGFRDLDDRYKQYVEECRRIKMEPRSIDYCISNTKEKKLRK